MVEKPHDRRWPGIGAGGDTYGPTASAWQLNDDKVKLNIPIPLGTTAHVHLDGCAATVGTGDHGFIDTSACVRSRTIFTRRRRHGTAKSGDLR
ncbi:alpha-L-rhamnosidase C-terminal domain-containing protein [Nocardia sp. CA-084685]|uniref:alpha-L-rhamnosidase C-terminal domain-containing protein n=1 Tax=Nocardia sp. CA-084685 TaxID=3239970 RepID=UPI003D99D3EC